MCFNCFPVLLSGNKLRQASDNSYSLFIQNGVDLPRHFRIGHESVDSDETPHENSATNTKLFGLFGVDRILLNELHNSVLGTLFLFVTFQMFAFNGDGDRDWGHLCALIT